MFEKIFSKFKKKPLQRNALIVAAGGSGVRMGTEENKLLLMYEGRTVIEMALSACQEAKKVDDIIIVANEKIIVEISEIVKQFQITKVTKIVRGGATRTESVAKGMAELSEDIAFVGIHDGARPFVTPESIDEVFWAAEEFGAAALGIKLVDTIKTQKNGIITGGIDRDELVAMQTPQVFNREIFDVAIAYGMKKNDSFTDDVAVYQLVKKPVHIVWGSPKNKKITTLQDFE